MNKSQFLAHIIPTLVDVGASIRIDQQSLLDGRYGGWFESDPLNYAVANGNPCSFEIAVHEYNHFLQWRDHRSFWNKYADSDALFDAIQNSNEITARMVNKAIRLEHDCEIRSLEMIGDLQLEIDPLHYARCANAYLFSYHVVRHVGAWSHVSVYNVPQIIDSMPEQLFNVDYYLNPNNMPENCIEHMIDLCFKRP